MASLITAPAFSAGKKNIFWLQEEIQSVWFQDSCFLSLLSANYRRFCSQIAFAICKKCMLVKAQTFGAELGTVVDSRMSITWQTYSSRKRTRRAGLHLANFRH